MSSDHATIVVFGSTGVGKSSIINMLPDSDSTPEEQAQVSDSAVGVTLQSKSYTKILNPTTTLTVYDTAGLNESPTGSVKPRDAVEGLFNLTTKISNGINLLVLVIRRGSLKRSMTQNYDMFYKIICNRSVPIVLIITGGEDIPFGHDDDWWNKNRSTFDSSEMFFDDCACITSLSSSPRLEDSRQKVISLIQRNIRPQPWKAPQKVLFYKVLQQSAYILKRIIGSHALAADETLAAALQTYSDDNDTERIQTISLLYKPYSRDNRSDGKIKVVLCGYSQHIKRKFDSFKRSGTRPSIFLSKDIEIFDAVFDPSVYEGMSHRRLRPMLNALAKFNDVNLVIFLTDDATNTAKDEACYNIFIRQLTTNHAPVVHVGSDQSPPDPSLLFDSSIALTNDATPDKVRMEVSRLIYAHQRPNNVWTFEFNVSTILNMILLIKDVVVSCLPFGKPVDERAGQSWTILGYSEAQGIDLFRAFRNK